MAADDEGFLENWVEDQGWVPPLARCDVPWPGPCPNAPEGHWCKEAEGHPFRGAVHRCECGAVASLSGAQEATDGR